MIGTMCEMEEIAQLAQHWPVVGSLASIASPKVWLYGRVQTPCEYALQLLTVVQATSRR
jgi:hypothetical protein